MLQRYYTEIKSRALLLTISGILILLVGYTFKEVLLSIVVNLYNGSSSKLSYFIFTDVVEIFNVYVVLIFFVWKQILSFQVVYHFLVFLIPGLTKSEYKYLLLFFSISSGLFLLSVILFKKILFPFSWNFFLSFNSFVEFKALTLHFEAKLLDYIMFFINLYFSCILYFQFFLIPSALFIYFNTDLSTYKTFRKFLYYGCIIFSTLVTPPDVTSQIILSTVLIIGCEILVFGALLKSLLKRNQLVR
uniref:SecY-independent transporter protein n=1 Tax=Navicula ramosissima TaxID=265559 RepID=A0A343A6V5_9STRA|nr:SecY-independent transporter protein [Navicula ramosissima]AOY40393.1 SecY-independent transporter protein [Navicula ramosissima]